MPRKPGLPAKRAPLHRTILRTYAELQARAALFADGSLHPILLVGRPGVGKTYTWESTIKSLVPDRKILVPSDPEDTNSPQYEVAVPGYGWINNAATAYGLYRELWRYANCPLVIDDVHSLDRDSGTISLLKTVTNTTPIKRVSWTSRVTEQMGAPPQEFDTTSGITLITNNWNTDNAFVQALEDRAKCYEFRPSSLEVHKYVATWFDDQAAFDWVAQRLPVLPNLSIRDYEKVRDLRKTGLPDWEADATQQVGLDPVVVELVRVLNDPKLQRPQDKIDVWSANTGLGRSSFYAPYKQMVDEALGNNLQPPPQIILPNARKKRRAKRKP